MKAKESKIERPHLSQTQILTYSRCPEHFLFRYILGLVLPPKAVMAKGSAIHRTIATFYKVKRKTGKNYSALDLGEIFQQEFEIERPKIDWDKEKEDSAEVIDKGYKILKEYRDVVGVKTKPLDIEKEIVISFKNTSYDFKVITDLIDKDHFIHEAKVKGRMLSKADIENDLQLTVEAMAHRVQYKKAEKGIWMDIMLDQGKYPVVKQVKAKRTQGDINRALVTIAQISNAIAQNSFYCVHPSESWTCSKEWCKYEEMGLHKEYADLVLKYGTEKAIEVLKEKYVLSKNKKA